ncbi:MAG: NADH-quinone oxidoreductase subunit F [Deltaproteobacteria bacterium]|nr:NADH-quinone oxidoreductase subunit F [Deltaproteobacteria bacterium]
MPENRVLLKKCEAIDPGDVDSYVKAGGFKALKKARDRMSPVEVIEALKASGLRGRGGAGFPCGAKWELARNSREKEKFLICNADEGEVGAFKDRYVLQNDPFSVIEGMAIAAYAVGAQEAYIYLRAEYHFLLEGLKRAVEQVKAKGLLKSLDIKITEGAGAYVCGEESALMNSIEGRRGEARCRPPYPPTRGLFEKPTIINNVETLINVPHIIAKGPEWYAKLGTEKSKGTKLFSVSGDVRQPGVYEMELGCKLGDLLTLARAENVKLVQVGGASGRIVPHSMLDTRLSFETILGSGAITVFNESRDVIDIVSRTMGFFNKESCGKCTPCREGAEVMVEIFGRLVKGDGVHEDLEILEDLSHVMMDASMCGLGQTAPIPVLDTLKYFRSEYENRIDQSAFLRRLKVISA